MAQEELLADDTQYCCYCGQEKVKFHCCGENHFQTFAQMDKDEQDAFLEAELVKRAEDAFNRSKWVGLTKEEAADCWSNEAVRTWEVSNLPNALRLAACLEETMQWPVHGKAADELRRLHAELESIKQAITDPENQPSQFGTVTLEYMNREMKGL